MQDQRNDPEGCAHYRNQCKILAPCCDKFYRCHHCHNEEREHLCGLLDRSGVKQIKCCKCDHQQSPPSDRCGQCGIIFAEYFCRDCNLYRQSDAINGLFHCHDCGICRVGKGLGPDGSHWHCQTCCACLPNSIDPEQHAKICRSDGLKKECCICFEDMHQSQIECVIGPYCGHFLHRTCFETYLRSGKFKCPLCQKSLIDEGVVRKAGRKALLTKIGMEFCHAILVLLMLVYLPEKREVGYEKLCAYAWCAVLFTSRVGVAFYPGLAQGRLQGFAGAATLYLYLLCLIHFVKRCGSYLADKYDR